MRNLVLAAAAFGAAMISMPAAAQTGPWKVVAAVPAISIFAGDVSGPQNARQVYIFLILPEAAGGIDNSINRWTIDCNAKTALDHGGTSYLGTQSTGDLETITPNGAEPFSEGLTSLVGDYVCSGVRISTDTVSLRDVPAARAYAKSKFTN